MPTLFFSPNNNHPETLNNELGQEKLKLENIQFPIKGVQSCELNISDEIKIRFTPSNTNNPFVLYPVLPDNYTINIHPYSNPKVYLTLYMPNDIQIPPNEVIVLSYLWK